MFNGRDGISLVSRIAAAALAAHGSAVNVYSLAVEPNTTVPDGVSLWNAKNCSSKFVARVASRALGSVATTDRVLAMHVHLAGTALPLVWRGAKLSIFLHGIEAWKPLRLRENSLEGRVRRTRKLRLHQAAVLRRQPRFPRPSRYFMPSRNCTIGCSRGAASPEAGTLRAHRGASGWRVAL